MARYRGEPYAVAADVSSAKSRVGRSGWTWYTGSASWMYRIWMEEVLGFHLRGATLTVSPVIPEEWPGFEITYRYGSTLYEVEVRKDSFIDAPDPNVIHLTDDGGSHKVILRIPRRKDSAPQPAAVTASNHAFDPTHKLLA